jgi:hypothetical protein
MRKLNSGKWIFEMYQPISSAQFKSIDAEYSQVKYISDGVPTKVAFETPLLLCNMTINDWVKDYDLFYVDRGFISFKDIAKNTVAVISTCILRNPQPELDLKNPIEIINSITESGNIKSALDNYAKTGINRNDIMLMCKGGHSDKTHGLPEFIIREWLNSVIDNSNQIFLLSSSVNYNVEMFCEYVKIARKLCLGEYSTEKAIIALQVVITTLKITFADDIKQALKREIAKLIDDLKVAKNKDMSAIAQLMPTLIPYLI